MALLCCFMGSDGFAVLHHAGLTAFGCFYDGYESERCMFRSRPGHQWRLLLAYIDTTETRRKQRSVFDQVSEFDRGRMPEKEAYRDCGLPFREICSRVGRNQTTVMRICNRWMQESTTNQRGRSHPPQCTTSHEDRQIVRMAVTDRSVTSRTVSQHIVSVTHHSVSARTIRRHLK
ncbi:transposable element Tcb1 transposase [Trichonephila clavipes]|uniref:Transposable element Tcb1 transposase n=1 Tax=Trichonephila clavipes TaxID=2585209 RepID=A0A8X6UV12_TRICX|nr:transposable element Tcb1 transposase [Trichonephila clavipes]